MAKQGLQFGDKNTADTILHLIGSSGKEYRGEPLFVHSVVLKKAEFFEAKLSELSSSDKRPFEMKVTDSHSRENYIKCIQFMYSYHEDERFYVSCVDDALAILPVASQIMFHDCIQSCMLYLNAVRWSPEEKAKLGALLTSLQIDILPDLAARLGILRKFDSEHIEMVKESLQELLSRTLKGSKEYRRRAEKHMLDYFEANASPAVKDVCRSALMKEFNADVESIKSEAEDIDSECSRLLWLVGVIKSCDGKLYETVLKLFCEDTTLRNSINSWAVKAQDYSAAYDILDILSGRFLKDMGDAHIITPTSFRVFFLTNWVDTMVNMVNIIRNLIQYRLLNTLEDRIIEVGETLPLVEQKRIYNIWKNALIKHSLSSTKPFDWWVEKMHEAIINDKIM